MSVRDSSRRECAAPSSSLPHKQPLYGRPFGAAYACKVLDGLAERLSAALSTHVSKHAPKSLDVRFFDEGKLATTLLRASHHWKDSHHPSDFGHLLLADAASAACSLPDQR